MCTSVHIKSTQIRGDTQQHDQDINLCACKRYVKRLRVCIRACVTKCDNGVLKLCKGLVMLLIFYVTLNGSYAHLVAEQHDDHILLGMLVYFSQPSLQK